MSARIKNPPKAPKLVPLPITRMQQKLREIANYDGCGFYETQQHAVRARAAAAKAPDARALIQLRRRLARGTP